MDELNVITNSRMMLPVGTMLQGNKYRVERYLASGGFGNTYMATNVLFEEHVAIKEFFMRGVTERENDTISISVSNSDNLSMFVAQKNKFMKEARRLRRLKNEHIVTVHDLFEENGTAYYVMDFISGESLSDRLKRTNSPLSEHEALIVFEQVLDALYLVHQQGIYHLDIKPANIMIDQNGRALLIDFGASKQIRQDGGATTSTGLCYTIGYAPIEQMEQTEDNLNRFGPWTDLYALGATLYKLLTNMTPPSASEILMKSTPLLFPVPVSAQTQQIINWMMKPSIIERPQSVIDVKNALKGNIPNLPKKVGIASTNLSEQTQTAYTQRTVIPNVQPSMAPNPRPVQSIRPQEKRQQGYQSQPYSNATSNKSKLPWIIGLVLGLFVFLGVTIGAFFVLYPSNVASTEVKATTEINGTYDLYGHVHTYPVTMHLEVGDKNVKGYYYYNRSSNPSSLTLTGIRNGQYIELNETAPDGTPSGHFKGTFSAGVYEGEFVNYQGKRMNFVISKNGGY